MTNYSNFNEQVDDNLTNLELFTVDDLGSYWEDLATHIYDNSDRDYEVILDELEGIYQIYEVTLKGDYNQNHVDMQIIYSEEFERYLMPVYCFGISWSMVGAMTC